MTKNSRTDAPVALLRLFFRMMSVRLSKKVFHHSGLIRSHAFASAFTRAPLRVCPGMTMNLMPGDVGHAEIAFTGVYEPDVTETIARIARTEGGLMFDVGANFGYFTLLWCGLNAKNRSIAFEASPRVLPRLRENIRQNGLEDRVQIIEGAVSRAPGKVSFSTGPDDQTGWGGIAGDQNATESIVEVDARRLDSLSGDEPVTLLKIDCEGADAWVIEGASGLLHRKSIMHVCFEENDIRSSRLGIPSGESERLLRTHGYQCKAINARPPFFEFHAWI